MSAVRSQDPTMDTQSWSSARRWWARVCPSASTLTTNSNSTFTFSLGTRETMEKKDSVVAPETMEDEPAADWLPRTPTQSLSLSSSRKFLKLRMKLNSQAPISLKPYIDFFNQVNFHQRGGGQGHPDALKKLGQKQKRGPQIEPHRLCYFWNRSLLMTEIC